MKVLYIDVNYKYSSTGKIVFDLFSQCKVNSIDAFVCYGRGPKVVEKDVFKFGLDWETKLHAFLTRVTGYTGCFSFFSTKRLISYIKKIKPDIIHIHELHAYFVNIKQLLGFLKKENYKVVFTNHCEFLYTGKCGHAKECIKYSLKCGKCPNVRGYPKSLFFDCTKRMLSIKKSLFLNWNEKVFITCPSNWLNKKMDISFLKLFRREVIPNGIDTSTFKYDSSNIKKDLGIPADKKIVLTVAPNLFSSTKGGYRFLEVADLMINDNVIFIGVGETTKPNRSIPKNVIIFPLIKDKTQLMKLYSCADVFIILSNYENFPTTCLEAQCCGTKVVGYDVGGVSETILSGNGFVVPYNDKNSLIVKMKKIIFSTYNHNIVSENAKKYYSKERMFSNYLEIYKRML